MSHRVTAVYDDFDKARLAAGDLQSAGVDPSHIVLTEGKIVVVARDFDHAINVKSFLNEDGAQWAEISQGAEEVPLSDTIPTVPASP